MSELDALAAMESLLGRAQLERPPLVEYIVDETVMRPVLLWMGRPWVSETVDRRRYLENFTAFYKELGYSLVKFERSLPFPSQPRPGSQQSAGSITSWEDFERYPWPRVEDYDFSPFELLNKHLPEGMGLMVSHAGGPFEILSELMSFEGLCLVLNDDLPLVQAVASRIGEGMQAFYNHLLDLDRVLALFPGDDMAYRNGTLLRPEHLRQLILPWHQRFARMAHDHGRSYFLHSCGNMASLMDDLIDTVGIDGKHSFEDAILTAEEFQEHYGGLQAGSVAVLGGVDLDTLASGTIQQVRERTRQLIDTCHPRGRFAIGSGNSITGQIPVENYLAMVEEARA